MKKRVITAITLAAALSSMFGGTAFAATSHYSDATQAAFALSYDDWKANWAETASDYTKVSIEPGADETKLNFCWMTEKDPDNAAVVLFGRSKSSLIRYKGTVEAADSSLTGGTEYVSNKVTVTGLEPNTTYYYSVVKNGVESEVRKYTTGSFTDVKMLFVGDPQIGASKGQTRGSETLANTDGASNTAACNDSYGWNRTLSIAKALNPTINYIISAGDQVNKTGKAKEEEFAGYLSADVLSGTAVATTIGNHDSLTSDYSAHFNVPNATDNGETKAGGDYYYSYGDGLFIVLNTNNYNAAEHEDTIKEAIASDPTATWRVVCIHQDIYGAGLDHSETDGMILRTQLTPIFDKYDVDVVLQGHDHSYCRSKLLYSDGKTHDSYQFNLDATGDDYDWDHAYDTTTGENISLYPEEGDTASEDRLQQFRDDNSCYTIEDAASNNVIDPKGILYITSNSASGSKYYELNTTQQDYIAKRSQNWLPSYSVIEMTSSTFKIETYEIDDGGTVSEIDDPFTITKTVAR